MCLYRPGWESRSCLSFSFWGKIHFFLPPKKKSVCSCSNTSLGIFENDFISLVHERNTTRFSLLLGGQVAAGVSGVENNNSILRLFEGLCTFFLLSSSFSSNHSGGTFVSLLLMNWIWSIRSLTTSVVVDARETRIYKKKNSWNIDSVIYIDAVYMLLFLIPVCSCSKMIKRFFLFWNG